MGRIPTRRSRWSIRRTARWKPAAWSIRPSSPATPAGGLPRAAPISRGRHRTRVRPPILVRHGGHQRVRECAGSMKASTATPKSKCWTTSTAATPACLNLLGGQHGRAADCSACDILDVAETRSALAAQLYQDMSIGSYGGITYGKTATMLLTLETIVGEQTLQNALHTYFMKYRFTHPTQEDFLRTVNEVAGQDLGWYWQQAVYGTQVWTTKCCAPTRSGELVRTKTLPKRKRARPSTRRRSSCIARATSSFRSRRKSSSITARPSANAGTARTVGCDTCIRRKPQVLSVQIDPDYQVTMDRNYLNNSNATEAAARQRSRRSRPTGLFCHAVPGPDVELAGMKGDDDGRRQQRIGGCRSAPGVAPSARAVVGVRGELRAGRLGHRGSAPPIRKALGHSLAGRSLTNGFDFGMFFELVRVPESNLFALARSIVTLRGLLFFLFMLFVTGGILTVYREDRQIKDRRILRRFRGLLLAVRAAGAVFARSLCASGFRVLGREQAVRSYRRSRRVGTDRLLHFAGRSHRCSRLLALFVRLWFDIAQVRAVVQDEHRMWPNLWKALGISWRNASTLFRVYLCISGVAWVTLAGRAIHLDQAAADRDSGDVPAAGVHHPDAVAYAAVAAGQHSDLVQTPCCGVPCRCGGLHDSGSG